MKLLRNSLLSLGLFASLLCSIPSQASKLTPSEKISIGSLAIVSAPAALSTKAGPVGVIAAALFGSYHIVAGSVEAGKDVAEFTMEGVSNGSRVSIQVSKSAAEKIGVSVGTTVEMVSHATGAMLIASGKMLAFIPNALGESLLHQEKITNTSSSQPAQKAPVANQPPATSLKPTGY